MNDIKTLRDILFDQMKNLAKAEPEQIDDEIKRSASLVQVSEAILNTATVEANIIAAVKKLDSEFIPFNDPRAGLPVLPKNEILKLGTEIDQENNDQEPEELFQDENNNEPINDELDEDELVEYGGRMVNKKTLNENRNKDKIHSHSNKYD